MRSSQDLRGLNGSNRCVERAFRDERLWPMSVTATESWVGWNACRRLQCRRRLDLDSQPRPRPWLSFSVRTRSRGGDVCFWHKADIRHDLLFVRVRGEADIQSGFMSTRPSKQVCVSSRALHAKYGEQASACLAGRPLDPTRDDSTRIGRGAVGVQVAAAHARGL